MNSKNESFKNVKIYERIGSVSMGLVDESNSDNSILDDTSFEQIELSVHEGRDTGSKNEENNNKKIGNLNAFLYNKNGDALIVIGPHWYFYICLSLVISSVSLSFLYFSWERLRIEMIITGVILYSVQLISYTYTTLSNPGLPRRDEVSLLSVNSKDSRYCEKCHVRCNKSEKINHCPECNVCIIGKLIILIKNRL